MLHIKYFQVKCVQVLGVLFQVFKSQLHLLKCSLQSPFFVQARSESLPRENSFRSPEQEASRDSLVVLRGDPHPVAPSHLPHPESQAAAALTFLREAPTPSSEWAQRRCFFVDVS
ncbi:hypothetical protein PAMP_011046 [Pampus punctatissimus]